jgi:hypothetical protein
MQAFSDCVSERPAIADKSSLQLRAISNVGTPSATPKTSCELKAIIVTEIGIDVLPDIVPLNTPGTEL